MAAMVRIAKYINKTKDEFLVFNFGGDINLSAYVDASFMCHRDTGLHRAMVYEVTLYGFY